MLKRLAISNYALIDNLDIDFSNDLNILTGETGAGKSIILGALSLILGQRAEGKYFFNQQKKCIIEGTFLVNSFHLNDFFIEHELDYESETILRREISSDGKSRAFINDTPVNLTVLKKLGGKLIDIHSQHATLEINDADFQLLVVDTIAQNDSLLATYSALYKQYRGAESRLKDLISQSDQSKADLDYYQFQYNELENVMLTEDEQVQLEQELDVLTHAEEIKRSLLAATSLLSESDAAAITQLKEASLKLENAEKYNPEIKALTARLNSSLIEIKDILSEIERIEQKSSVDQGLLEKVSERLDIIYALQKKHRVHSNKELIGIKNELSDKLKNISFLDQDIENLKSELRQIGIQLEQLADQLRQSRNRAIPEVEEDVKRRLQEIGMPNAVLRIINEPLEGEKFDQTGTDRIQFLFSANKGQLPLPMNKVASGGELSRLMLSIKSLIAMHTSLPTIIFDEIDTGISGEIALKVGYIMEKLSKDMQVIAITHLPQIAARGKTHFTVYKKEDTDMARTHIRQLDDQERVMELARILSGNNPGESAMLNAKELMR